MHKLYVERLHTWTEKGFLRPAKYHVHERYALEIDSAELKRFLQNGGSIEQVLAASEPPKAIGTTQKSAPKKSKSVSSKTSKVSKTSKASKASKLPSPTSTTKVYKVHLPDCPHSHDMRRNGRVNPKKVRVVVLKRKHHHLVCIKCQRVARSAVPAAAVKNIS